MFQRAELEPPNLCRVRTHLSKLDIEELLDAYDNNPVDALTKSLSKILNGSDDSWDSIVSQIPESIASHSRLRVRDIAALDAVVKHLVEYRCLQK